MGRHSAPDGDANSFEGAAVVVAAPVVSRGRHSRPDEDQSGSTAFDDTAKIARINLVEATVEEPSRPLVDLRAVDEPVAAQPHKRAHEHSTAADVALIRAHGDIRARVIAAVIVPFAIYTAGMATLGKLDRSYLLWIWVPLITAGVLGGLFLDLGHRKYNR